MQFTFQYGQIYYELQTHALPLQTKIYIPIWLDLLLKEFLMASARTPNLHSNMVRFIIGMAIIKNTNAAEFTFQYGQIYYN